MSRTENITRLSAAFGLVLLPLAAHASVIATHSGANDPTANGWGTTGTFAGVTAGGVINDLGTGLDAWSVDDNGTTGGTVGWYTFDLTTQQVSDAATYGWTLSANVRVVDTPDPGPGDPSISADASPFFAYRSGTQSAQIHLGTEADGDPIAHFVTSLGPITGVSGILQSAGSGYHLYEMNFDPTTGISVAIDGTTLITGQTPFALSAASQVIWGAGSSCCTGQGHFNSVVFETHAPAPVPLPASAALLLAALAGLTVAKRQSRQT